MINNSKLASGDNSGSAATSPRYVETVRSNLDEDNIMVSHENNVGLDGDVEENITPQTIDDNEVKLKQRIDNCKKVVESLKFQITEEKEKLKAERKVETFETANYVSAYHHELHNAKDFGNSSMYSASVDSKLHYDENLIEYEKQLQKYQNTLNKAQMEKKNAIRKKMLAKAFKLKLMEIENQCNIEMLRVKQSMQCLEPLLMMVNKWETEPENNLYDINNFELISSFPEVKEHSSCDMNGLKEELDKTLDKEPFNLSKDD